MHKKNTLPKENDISEGDNSSKNEFMSNLIKDLRNRNNMRIDSHESDMSSSFATSSDTQGL